MSAIAGVFRFDDKPVERRELERVTNALAVHGPDRSNVWIGEGIGLAHNLMRMTPEDQFEQQPLRGASGAVMTADLRLDNRVEMLEMLGISAHDAFTWPDSKIVLMVWEKLGDATWAGLRGPFAIAIFDRNERTLTLARDHFGLNVVMWHKNQKFFAFSTMPRGLFALSDVPRELSDEKMADFIVLNHADHRTTIYRGVQRVLPAHVLKVNGNGSISEHRYWSETDIKPAKLNSDQAYAEGLRDCLDKAVRRQLRSAHGIGCYLSGGLDSSAVAALAAKALGEKGHRLAAYTQVPRKGFSARPPRGRYNDETPYVEAIAAMAGNIDITLLHNDECDDFRDLERFFVVLEGPVRNPTNLGWMLGIPRLARTQGHRVLLGGQFGNYTISWSGWSQSIDHLLRGRLPTAARQWSQFYRQSSHSGFTVFRKLFIDPLIPLSLGDWTRKIGRRGRLPWEEHSIIRDDFAAEMNVLTRARTVGHDFYYRAGRDERVYGLRGVDFLGDWNAALKAFTGVEVRDPTADVDVVQYCLGVPPEQYLVEEIDRSLVRRAMWGLLPASALTNRLNGLQSSDWFEKLQVKRAQLAQDVGELTTSPLASRMLNLEKLNVSLENWPEGGRWHERPTYYEYCLRLSRGVATGRFLRWIEADNQTPSAKSSRNAR